MGEADHRIFPACLDAATGKPRRDLEIWAAPLPFGAHRAKFKVPEGSTVTEILDACGVDLSQHVGAHVFVGGLLVPPDMWPSVRPKAGHLINVRAVPQGGGGGKSPLKTILTIAVMAAASWAAAAYAGTLAASMTGAFLPGGATAFQTAIAGGIIKAGVGAVGSLLVNAIAPPSKPKLNGLSAGAGSQRRESQTLFIQGARNQLIPFGVVPVVLGTHRMFPYQAAKPFTETAGDKQYSRQLFNWGCSTNLEIEDEKIGETLLSAFTGVETQHILDGNSTGVIPLFNNIPDQEDISVHLTAAASWQTRTTEIGVDELCVDITLPQGLVLFNSKGKRVQQTVAIEIRYSPAGAGTWTNLSDPALTLTGTQTSAMRRTYRIPVSNGQYDVQVRRVTADSASDQIFDQIYWTALRTFTYGNPVLDDGVCLTAMRILASEQLNGVVDQYNAIVSNLIPDWDYLTETWIVRKTSNPASIVRYILQGPLNDKPLADARLALPRLQEWHDYCRIRGLEFNAVIDYETTITDILFDVCAAGRASLARPDGKYSVVIDKENDDVVQHVSPRKSWGYQLEKSFPEIPHAFIVQFTNKDAGYVQDERIVYADGYTSANATDFQRLELTGVCSATEAYIHGREHMAVMQLRPEIHSFYMDVENLVATRGDRIKFNHDVILVGLGSGRVKAVSRVIEPGLAEDGAPVLSEGGEASETDGALLISSVDLDEPMVMELGKTYCLRFWLSDGTDLLKNVVTQPGTNRTLFFETPFEFSDGLQVGDHFMFGETGQESIDLVIQSIMPGADFSAQLRCVAYAPGIFTAATGTIPAHNSNITIPPELRRPDAPVILPPILTDETVAVRNSDGSIQSRMVISLHNRNTIPVVPVVSIRAAGDTDFVPANTVTTTPEQVIITGLDDGARYDVRIVYRALASQAVLAANAWSEPAVETNVLFEGEGNDPDDVENFTIEIVGSLALLKWTAVTNIDFHHYEVRYSSLTAGVTWETAQTLIPETTESRAFTQVRAGTYLVKAWDRTDHASAIAATATITEASVLAANVVETIEEHPSFAGSKTNCEIDGSTLIITDPSLLTATYDFANSIDLIQSYPCRVTVTVDAYGENPGFVMGDWASLSDVENLSGTSPGSWSVRIEMRMTDDDPGGSPVWSSWFEVLAADYNFRAAEFRAIITSADGVTVVVVQGLTVVVDMIDRIEGEEGVSSIALGNVIVYDPPFQEAPAVVITPKNGRKYVLSGDSRTGFTVVIYQSDNVTPATGELFNWIAKGWGREIV